jgi:hypothetical protein
MVAQCRQGCRKQVTVHTAHCGQCVRCVVCGKRDVFLEDTKEAFFAGKNSFRAR